MNLIYEHEEILELKSRYVYVGIWVSDPYGNVKGWLILDAVFPWAWELVCSVAQHGAGRV